MQDLDPADRETVRERDARRLQVMERYCYTTECLRNYILKYFGENPEKPCQDCGNCLREFETLDMTEAANLSGLEEEQDGTVRFMETGQKTPEGSR